MRAWLGIYLRGFCMGAADSVPGVSGGTIALISGIYDRLVTAITAADPRALGAIVRGSETSRSRALRELFVAMDGVFLLVLGFGIISAVVTAARVVEFALESYRALTFAFFFGLIAASAVVLAAELSGWTARRVGVAVLGLLLAVVVSGLNEGALSHSPLVVFGAGAVAISAMVLPGISGSLILLVLGQYHYMLEQLNGFVESVHGLLDGGSLDSLAGTGVPVVAFISGAVVGLMSIAHLIRWALVRYRGGTLTFLTALMVGALRKPIDVIAADVTVWTVPTAGSLLLAAFLGGLLVIGFERSTGGIDY